MQSRLIREEVIYTDLINELMRLNFLFKQEKAAVMPPKSKVIISRTMGALIEEVRRCLVG